jgi:hypothetical protein
MYNILSIGRASVFAMPCLFCFVYTHEIHITGMLQIAFLVSLESSLEEASIVLGLRAAPGC